MAIKILRKLHINTVPSRHKKYVFKWSKKFKSECHKYKVKKICFDFDKK